MTVLIAGAGIAGLTMGLTLHAIGVPFRIFERVKVPKPLIQLATVFRPSWSFADAASARGP